MDNGHIKTRPPHAPDSLTPTVGMETDAIERRFQTPGGPRLLDSLDNPQELIAAVTQRGSDLSVAEVLLSELLAEIRGQQLEQYRESRSLQLSGAGAGTFTFLARLGYRLDVGHIAVSVGGASSAATVAVYVSSADDATEEQLADFASGLFGSSPSRTTAHYAQVIPVGPDERLVVKIAGAVASQQASVRVSGMRHVAT